MLEAGRVPKGFCQLCHVKEAVISCTDCLPKHMLCSQCDICVHRQYSCITDLRLSGAVTEPFLQRLSLSMMRVVRQHWAKKVFMCIHFLWNILFNLNVREVTNIPLFSIVRLLPFALPKSICSKAENVSVVGKKLSWST